MKQSRFWGKNSIYSTITAFCYIVFFLKGSFLRKSSMRDNKIVVTVTIFMLTIFLWLRETSSLTLNIPATNDTSYKLMFETLSCAGYFYLCSSIVCHSARVLPVLIMLSSISIKLTLFKCRNLSTKGGIILLSFYAYSHPNEKGLISQSPAYLSLAYTIPLFHSIALM